MSPFEIKGTLISLAEKKARRSTATLLNAGRGNPNWVLSYPRKAFFLLGEFEWKFNVIIAHQDAFDNCFLGDRGFKKNDSVRSVYGHFVVDFGLHQYRYSAKVRMFGTLCKSGTENSEHLP